MRIKDEDACDICLDDDFNDENPIVYCDGCDICVHQGCYGITDAEMAHDHWYCKRCTAQNGSASNDQLCLICGTSNTDFSMKRLKYTDGPPSPDEASLWVHCLCYRLFPGLIYEPEDAKQLLSAAISASIAKQRSSVLQKQCSGCSSNSGSLVRCQAPVGCQRYYHPPCIVEAGGDVWIETTGNYDTIHPICPTHTATNWSLWRFKQADATMDSMYETLYAVQCFLLDGGIYYPPDYDHGHVLLGATDKFQKKCERRYLKPLSVRTTKLDDALSPEVKKTEPGRFFGYETRNLDFEQYLTLVFRKNNMLVQNSNCSGNISTYSAVRIRASSIVERVRREIISAILNSDILRQHLRSRAKSPVAIDAYLAGVESSHTAEPRQANQTITVSDVGYLCLIRLLLGPGLTYAFSLPGNASCPHFDISILNSNLMRTEYTLITFLYDGIHRTVSVISWFDAAGWHFYLVNLPHCVPKTCLMQ